MTALSGVLPVDKPKGPTSHDIVGAARRALHTRKIGHTGTLDPFASGLLLLCIGPATRLAEYLTALPKSYRARMVLGVATTTDDSEGETTATSDEWKTLDVADVRAALMEQQGDILQVPPQFSAKRVAGERMYAIARRGGSAVLEPVPVRIDRVEMTAYDLPFVEFEVDCGSGTYIRAIARDVGERLGVGGHLDQLRRTRVGDFDAGAAVPADQLGDEALVQARMIAPAQAVGHLPRWTASAEDLPALGNGRRVPVDFAADGPVAILAPGGDLFAIGEVVDGEIQPRKVLA